MPATISALHVYPVKSCRGTSLTTARLDARGIVGDRQWMIVDTRGIFLTQRDLPRMALVEVQLDDRQLRLMAPGMDPFSLSIHYEGPRCEVMVWDDECSAVDQGEEAGQWLSQCLNIECRLVRMAPDCVRRVDPDYATRPTDQVGFSDGFPLLLISEGSLADLNTRLAEPLPMDRFRPNIVVAGCEPYAEDGWKQIHAGAMTLSIVKPCARCKLTTIDQLTAETGKEPLRSLAAYRTVAGRGVLFGQNVVHDGPGVLRVGDPITAPGVGRYSIQPPPRT